MPYKFSHRSNGKSKVPIVKTRDIELIGKTNCFGNLIEGIAYDKYRIHDLFLEENVKNSMVMQFPQCANPISNCSFAIISKNGEFKFSQDYKNSMVNSMFQDMFQKFWDYSRKAETISNSSSEYSDEMIKEDDKTTLERHQGGRCYNYTRSEESTTYIEYEDGRPNGTFFKCVPLIPGNIQSKTKEFQYVTMKDGKQEGFGIDYKHGEFYYMGEFENNKRHGYGLLYDYTENRMYCGHFVDGRRDGEGYELIHRPLSDSSLTIEKFLSFDSFDDNQFYDFITNNCILSEGTWKNDEYVNNTFYCHGNISVECSFQGLKRVNGTVKINHRALVQTEGSTEGQYFNNYVLSRDQFAIEKLTPLKFSFHPEQPYIDTVEAYRDKNNEIVKVYTLKNRTFFAIHFPSSISYQEVKEFRFPKDVFEKPQNCIFKVYMEEKNTTPTTFIIQYDEEQNKYQVTKKETNKDMSFSKEEFQKLGDDLYSLYYVLLERVNYQSSTIEYEGGAVYRGEMKNGQMNGHGTYSERQQTIYEGEWKNGQRHGQGTYHYILKNKKPMIFSGHWERNRLNPAQPWTVTFSKGFSLTFDSINRYVIQWNDQKFNFTGRLKSTTSMTKFFAEAYQQSLDVSPTSPFSFASHPEDSYRFCHPFHQEVLNQLNAIMRNYQMIFSAFNNVEFEVPFQYRKNEYRMYYSTSYVALKQIYNNMDLGVLHYSNQNNVLDLSFLQVDGLQYEFKHKEKKASANRQSMEDHFSLTNFTFDVESIDEEKETEILAEVKLKQPFAQHLPKPLSSDRHYFPFRYHFSYTKALPDHTHVYVKSQYQNHRYSLMSITIQDEQTSMFKWTNKNSPFTFVCSCTPISILPMDSAGIDQIVKICSQYLDQEMEGIIEYPVDFELSGKRMSKGFISFHFPKPQMYTFQPTPEKNSEDAEQTGPILLDSMDFDLPSGTVKRILYTDKCELTKRKESQRQLMSTQFKNPVEIDDKFDINWETVLAPYDPSWEPKKQKSILKHYGIKYRIMESSMLVASKVGVYAKRSSIASAKRKRNKNENTNSDCELIRWECMHFSSYSIYSSDYPVRVVSCKLLCPRRRTLTLFRTILIVFTLVWIVDSFAENNYSIRTQNARPS